MPKIVLENISKRWGSFVGVDHLYMTIEDRDFITLLGPSGCGKTTTLRMIAGLETPTEGKITIGDKVVFDSEKGINISPAKRDVGFLFQNYALWPHMTVYQNIAFGLENMKWSKADIRTRVDEMLAMLKIEQFEHRYPSELSGGQQQRVAIARTLAPKPKVLFMDEPLSNLDAKLRLEMRTELKRLHMDTDSTFVYVTHDQLEAMTLATKVCLMEVGVLQQYDPPLYVYNSPNNLFVADFVGSPTMNFIDATITKVNKKGIEVEMLGSKFKFEDRNGEFNFDGLTGVLPDKIDGQAVEVDANAPKVLEGSQVVVGVRPEYLLIEDDGIDATVYSALPAGMETTVKLQVGEELLTSVVFGDIDYEMNQALKFNFKGDKTIVFDKASGARVAQGKLVY